MADPRVLTRCPRALERWQGPAVRVLVAGTGAVSLLEGAGAMVWAGLAHPGTRDDLLAAMIEALPPVDRGQAAGLLDHALDQMQTAGLVVEVDPTSPDTPATAAAAGTSEVPDTHANPATPETADGPGGPDRPDTRRAADPTEPDGR